MSRSIRLRRWQHAALARFSASGNAETGVILHLARIEVAPVELPGFLADGAALKVAEALKKIGYAHVTLDLLGYRRGSVNEGLAASGSARRA